MLGNNLYFRKIVSKNHSKNEQLWKHHQEAEGRRQLHLRILPVFLLLTKSKPGKNERGRH